MKLLLNKSRISKRPLLLVVFCACLLIIVLYTNSISISPYIFNISHNYTSKYPYIALIVDDRATQLLVNAVINVLQHIPIDWKVQIITPHQHWLFYKKSSLSSLIQANRVFLTPLEQTRNGLSSGDFINPILTSASFWHQVQGDKVLFFQTDSVLCSNSLYNLTDFLQYDFIGAPWSWGGCCNGGLSIRNRQKILQMLESSCIHYQLHTLNEDGWFTNNLPDFNGSVAPTSVAKRFSVETMYHSRPFGVHKPHLNTIGQTNMKHLCNECPEVSTITPDCQTLK
ncbi:unnamed protein product [Adineta steineri]|uniref:DUF5672 domain-containing protein n=1 Tax=Adineta steineri TaxID=433720 RepID=A0A819C0T6_9BILA|nr:unnamed protein product [Adineta steineri]CAF3806624.1 unnamed protein product [Adineta steineri]